MKYLLDTHILMWWLNNDKRLTPKIKDILKNKDEILVLSNISLWEMIIKSHVGKLEIPNDIPGMLKHYGFEMLDMKLKHTLQYRKLELIHRDPFDRMLIAQGMVEQLTIITHDVTFTKYPCATLIG